MITGNAFKNIADDFLDESKSFIDLSLKPKIIFLYTDWLPLFKQKVLPKIDYQFKLITHNSDLPVKQSHLDILDDKRLLKWYGMNCHIKHPKLQPIPIGIANEKWPHGNKKVLMEVINTPVEKIDRVYCNFKPETTSVRRDIIPELLKHDFIDFKEPNLSFKDYLLQLKSYKWVISPPGNSIDCHRIWESIYVGTIPIVLNHICHNSWIDLPIQFINSFTNITIEGLTSQYDQIINKSKEKSRFIYYTEIINE